MRLFQGIIIGWLIGSMIDYILISLDYRVLFESAIRLPRIIYMWYLSTVIGRWLDTIKTLILLDRKLKKDELDVYTLDSMLSGINSIRENVVENKTKLTWIKRLTLDNTDGIIELINCNIIKNR